MHCTKTALVLLGLFLAAPANAGQQETCTMDDKTHVAKYSCPDGFEVVYTGTGTKVCDGACFKKGRSESLQQVIELIVEDRWGHDYFLVDNYKLGRASITKASNELLQKGKATITDPKKGVLEFIAPRDGPKEWPKELR